MKEKITIAIDGHSSTGKSTLAKTLAKHLGYLYVDSGAMYRCVTLFAMKQGLFNVSLNKEALINKLDHIKISFSIDHKSQQNAAYLNGERVEDEIRRMDVSEKVSEVATIPEVRAHLVQIQQEMGKQKGVVMDGRDIGTVVFPDAELKIFMTAKAETRAKRRYDELKLKGEKVDYNSVLKNVIQRDETDSNRTESPLIISEGAKVLDNSVLTREEQLVMALKWAEEAMA